MLSMLLVKDEMLVVVYLAIFIVGFVITILITSIILMVRFSDVYLDDKYGIEA